MPTPRQVLDLLSPGELRQLAGHLNLAVSASVAGAATGGGELVVALLAAERLASALATLERKRLKELCGALGIETSGKEKAGIAARLLDERAASARALGSSSASLSPVNTSSVSGADVASSSSSGSGPPSQPPSAEPATMRPAAVLGALSEATPLLPSRRTMRDSDSIPDEHPMRSRQLGPPAGADAQPGSAVAPSSMRVVVPGPPLSPMTATTALTPWSLAVTPLEKDEGPTEITDSLAAAVSQGSSPLSTRSAATFSEISGLIWQIAELLRGELKPHDYGQVILPMTLLRRLYCVLAPTQAAVLACAAQDRDFTPEQRHKRLIAAAGLPFYNTSPLDFARLRSDAENLIENLTSYIGAFSDGPREVFEKLDFVKLLPKLAEAGILFKLLARYGELPLDEATVPSHIMGAVFGDLIQRFSEQSSALVGEQVTPREVGRLLVELLLAPDHDRLLLPGITPTLLDPACGTGGLLRAAEERLREHNPAARLQVYGQEASDEAYAICRADQLIKGRSPERITLGNMLARERDGHDGERFDYLLCCPPLGGDWKKLQREIEAEHAQLGYAGRFGAGLPRVTDGSFLFLQHLLAKQKERADGGSRVAVVLGGSPLLTGDAGSGESRIRQWIFDNDWLEAIIALPDQLFFTTGAATYIWILSTRKPEQRKGRVQLISAVELAQPLGKPLGHKRHELSAAHIDTIVRTYCEFQPSETSKIFDTRDFGYQRIVVERPLRLCFRASSERIAQLREDGAFVQLFRGREQVRAGVLAALAALPANGVWQSRRAFEEIWSRALFAEKVVLTAPLQQAVLLMLGERDESAEEFLDEKGHRIPDPDLRDTENVPLKEDIAAYFTREILPHVPDAFLDESKTRIGYEIPFTRHFYKPRPARPLAEIEAEIRCLEDEIRGMLGEVLG